MDLNRPEINGLFAELDDLRQRVRRLERGNPLVGNVPAGESVQVVDPNDGSPLVKLGATSQGLGAEFFDSDGDAVLRLGDLAGARKGMEGYNGAGVRILRVDDRGLLEPNIPMVFTAVNGSFKDVAAIGSYEHMWECNPGVIPTQYVRFIVPIAVDAGAVTVTARFQTDAGQISTAKTIPANSVADYTFFWKLDDVLGVNASRIKLYVQRSAAVGVHVYPVQGHFGDWSATATSAGVWL